MQAELRAVQEVDDAEIQRLLDVIREFFGTGIVCDPGPADIAIAQHSMLSCGGLALSSCHCTRVADCADGSALCRMPNMRLSLNAGDQKLAMAEVLASREGFAARLAAAEAQLAALPPPPPMLLPPALPHPPPLPAPPPLQAADAPLLLLEGPQSTVSQRQAADTAAAQQQLPVGGAPMSAAAPPREMSQQQAVSPSVGLAQQPGGAAPAAEMATAGVAAPAQNSGFAAPVGSLASAQQVSEPAAAAVTAAAAPAAEASQLSALLASLAPLAAIAPQLLQLVQNPTLAAAVGETCRAASPACWQVSTVPVGCTSQDGSTNVCVADVRML